ncbi:MAG: VOC family protein [Bacteroidales bacterium]
MKIFREGSGLFAEKPVETLDQIKFCVFCTSMKKENRMKEKTISGIQQIGIGVTDLMDAWKWYYDVFGADIRVFEDETIAELMLPYTGGSPQKRHAALAFNLQGGGGFEVWQYTERTPQTANFNIQLGDYGIYVAKIKCKDVEATYDLFNSKQIDVLNTPQKAPDGKKRFFVRDLYGNHFQMVEGHQWYKDENKLTGGTYGAFIGVSDIENSLNVYRDILGYDQVIYDEEGTFDDLRSLPGGDHQFRRVLLTHSNPREGGFSPLLGNSRIELLQVKDRNPQKIYKNRFWGDPGFIHLCFDIRGMDVLKQECSEKGLHFTVDSHIKHNQDNSFDMGDAAGHFSYIEDPDGTLIEFVETHKVPIIRKLGWYINLNKRNPHKSLPNWLIKALSFNRVKF